MAAYTRRVAIVTGGTGGLGSALAEQLKDEWHVIIVGRTEVATAEVAARLKVDYVAFDVTDERACKHAFGRVFERLGRIDALVNGAGLWLQGPVDTHCEGEVDALIRTNVTGTIIATGVVAPILRQLGGGTIVNINSQGGLYAKAERTVYTASKWALTGFARALRDELGPHKVRVIDVLPGKMKTGFFARSGVEKDFSDALDPAEVAKAIAFAMNMPPHVVISELGIQHI